MREQPPPQKGDTTDKETNDAGTNSYTLFTLDKLIYKIVKHLQVILADDASIKLAELYKYEQSRGGKDGHVIEAVYYQNAHILLHEDPTFRFESHPDGRFTIQLLDTDRSEVPAGTPTLPCPTSPLFCFSTCCGGIECVEAGTKESSTYPPPSTVHHSSKLEICWDALIWYLLLPHHHGPAAKLMQLQMKIEAHCVPEEHQLASIQSG